VKGLSSDLTLSCSSKFRTNDKIPELAMVGCFSHATLGYLLLAANAFGMFTDSLLLLD
jgi:hypothetical protein